MNAPEQVRLDLPAAGKSTEWEVWLDHPELHRKYTFEQAMKVKALAICIRNEAHARTVNGR